MEQDLEDRPESPSSPVTPGLGRFVTGNHPAVRFETLPMTPGPLSNWESQRAGVLAEVVNLTLKDLSSTQSPDQLLAETLYLERTRIRRARPNLFERSRIKGDRELWGRVRRDLIKPAVEADRRALLESVAIHYAKEIGGHFDARVYDFATRAVPFGMSWLLNAATVQRFLPWGLTESLESRLRVSGEITALKDLSQKGTILLVPTHQSNIDSVLIGYIIYLMGLPPFSYGAGLNLFSNPVLSFFMSRLGAYTVDRQKSNPIYRQMLRNYSTSILRHGVHSIFFPGGGRARSGAIESRLKLGLLGTGLDAQLQGLRTGAEKPNVYVVPMVVSYHFVLEAGSLIEDFLSESGKHRFFGSTEDDSWRVVKIVKFFWRLFSSETGLTVRIGRPLDVFGNFVDEEGRSVGPNGTVIDPVKWLTTRGELRPELGRDREYTMELGRKLVDRYHKENTVLTSHLVAFSFFEALREKYPGLDVYRFMRLSMEQRSLPYADFLRFAERMHARVLAAAERGEMFLAAELATSLTERWVEDGLRQLGVFHDAAVVRVGDGAIWTEDMGLLYYYRNRMAGYGLSRLAENVSALKGPGAYDSKGFLA